MYTNSNAVNNNRGWNSKRSIELSDNLGKAYNPGLDNARSNKKTNSWDANKFIEMSRHLSSAYGADF